MMLSLPRFNAQIEHRIDSVLDWELNEHPMPVLHVLSADSQQFMDTPLSATEQEMFILLDTGLGQGEFVTCHSLSSTTGTGESICCPP
jgi:hypothetical protein